MAEKSESVKKSNRKKAGEKKPVVFESVAKVLRAKRGYGRAKFPRGFKFVVGLDGKVGGCIRGQDAIALAAASPLEMLRGVLTELGLRIEVPTG